MGLSIKTCYTVKIQKQLDATQDKTTEKLNIVRERAVDSRLMRQTSLICLEARMGYDHECGVKAEKTSDRYVSAPNKNGCSEVSGV